MIDVLIGLSSFVFGFLLATNLAYICHDEIERQIKRIRNKKI